MGDWTVKRVAGDANAEDKDVTTAITGGDVATPGTKKNMCTFNGVRQGDSVYVVVNDPQMTLATAQTLAHQVTSRKPLSVLISLICLKVI